MTEIDRFRLAQQLRISLSKARRAMREHMGGRLGMTASQSEALGYVERLGPITITELAKKVGVRPQSMGATVGVLLEAGLVTVTPHPTDGRQKVVATTDDAARLVTESRTVRDDMLAQRLEHLTGEELRTLSEASALLDRIFDPDNQQGS
ncbi:MAG: MarR family transcriptional regulator [Nocardioides sp.]|nr:MarR family transcriptional regulator [Nocardioides sp.]